MTRIHEPCRCDKASGRAECLSLTHGPRIYRMVVLTQFEAKCRSYEFRARSIEEATDIAEKAARERKGWFIRVNEIIYPAPDPHQNTPPLFVEAESLSPTAIMERPEDELIVVNRRTGEVLDCSKRYILLDWHTWTILGAFGSYAEAAQKQAKRQWKTTRVCLLLTESNE